MTVIGIHLGPRRARAWACASLAAVAFAVLGGTAPASAAHTRMSFEFYHSTLAPFGSWHVSGGFGRVWIPRVQVIGWHPYAYGHWMYSDLGWTWVSAYEWGAIPYHYGTWALDPELGWVWVPGYVWAPAWVVFRSGPSYVGWAPVPPGFSVGASFSFSDYHADHFVFVREGDFLARNVHRVAVPSSRTRVVFDDTTIVNNNLRIENNVVVNRGIDVQRIERVARAPAPRAPIERVPKAAPVERVTRDELSVDPSQIERGRVRAAAPAPAQDAAPAEKAPRERARDAERPRQREPEQIEPRREPAREQPRIEREREQPRIEPERERRPQIAPRPEQPQQRQQQPRGKHRGGPPTQGGPGQGAPLEEHGAPGR